MDRALHAFVNSDEYGAAVFKSTPIAGFGGCDTCTNTTVPNTTHHNTTQHNTQVKE